MLDSLGSQSLYTQLLMSLLAGATARTAGHNLGVWYSMWLWPGCPQHSCWTQREVVLVDKVEGNMAFYDLVLEVTSHCSLVPCGLRCQRQLRI